MYIISFKAHTTDLKISFVKFSLYFISTLANLIPDAYLASHSFDVGMLAYCLLFHDEVHQQWTGRAGMNVNL